MFEELNLSAEVARAIKESGFETPTEVQARCIPVIMEGKDVIGRSQTGSGKTLAFGIPAAELIDKDLLAVQVLVICPTRELAMQVTAEMRKATTYKEGCRIVDVYGGADIKKQINNLKTAKIVVATPGRLMDHIKRRTIKLNEVKMVVLDEADEMLNMGFRDDIEKILKSVPKQRQTVMFSATMPSAILAITRQYMVSPEMVEVGISNSAVSEIEQSFIMTAPDGKKEALKNLFETAKPQSAIVFCNTKRMAELINKFLQKQGIGSVALHGDMRQSERKRVMSDMKSKKTSVLVATDVAARGIDINDIEYVINFDLPNDSEYYIHRIGRTGRAGKCGKAVTILNARDQYAKIRYIVSQTQSELTEHPLSDKSDFHKPKANLPFARNGYRSRTSSGRR